MTTAIDLIIKLGGSAITDKGQLETLDAPSLSNAAKLIKQCLDSQLSCVVVHGAGSFGHHQAKQFNVNGGWTTSHGTCNSAGDSGDVASNHGNTTGNLGNSIVPSEVRRGFCLTRQSVTKLHHIVTSALIEEDVPAVGVSVCGTWHTDNGKLQQSDVPVVARLLSAGLVPVLHGDCVLDTSKGCAILSGDTIIQTLCDQCTVSRVVFLSSVKGVYDKPPHLHTDAALLTNIAVTPDKILIVGNKGQGDTINSQCQMDHDVTGGMTLKLQTAADIVRDSEGRTVVYICKVASSFAAQVCCHGNMSGSLDEGTVIHFETCGTDD